MKTENQYDILVIEDNFIHRAALERLLTESGYKVKTTDSAEQALKLVHEGIDCVVAGVISGDISRTALTKYWKHYFPETPAPLIHETHSVKSLVETINLGKQHVLRDAADTKAMLARLTDLIQACHSDSEANIPDKSDINRDNIIGHSPLMEEVFNLIDRSSRAFSTVLILGESGTGKDLVAQAIHRNSPRKAGPFIALSCAAMPESLVESELFGYEKGAFTGAVSARIGRFEAANGGTLFIDEIGDCPLSLQAKLLRILENRIVTPLGGYRETKVDTRVLTATSRDLPAMVAQGLFREDLYYRINIITIRVPPLRERREDIPLLLRAFIERVNGENHTSIDAISEEALQALQHYHWPGNVRQLLNIIERAMVLADKNSTVITRDDLSAEVLESTATPVQQTGHAAPDAKLPPGVSEEFEHPRYGDSPESTLTMEQIERQAIQTALIRFDNNKTKAAHAIGISVRTLQRKLAHRDTPDLMVLNMDTGRLSTDK